MQAAEDDQRADVRQRPAQRRGVDQRCRSARLGPTAPCRRRRRRRVATMPSTPRGSSRWAQPSSERVEQEEQPDRRRRADQPARRAGASTPAARERLVLAHSQHGSHTRAVSLLIRHAAPRHEDGEPDEGVDHGVPRQLAGQRRPGDLGDAEHRRPLRDVPDHAGVVVDRDEDVAEERHQRQAGAEDLHGVLAGHQVADEDAERREDQGAQDAEHGARDPAAGRHVGLALDDAGEVDDGDRDRAHHQGDDRLDQM